MTKKASGQVNPKTKMMRKARVSDLAWFLISQLAEYVDKHSMIKAAIRDMVLAMKR